MKHTPGPWRYTREITKQGIDKAFIVGERYIAEIFNFCNPHSAPQYTTENDGFFVEAQANARLIAAAPDMLEALKAVLDNPASPDIAIVRAAIAKAEGK